MPIMDSAMNFLAIALIVTICWGGLLLLAWLLCCTAGRADRDAQAVASSEAGGLAAAHRIA